MAVVVLVGCSKDTPETSQAAEAEAQVAPGQSPDPDPPPPVDEKLIVEWAVRQKLNKPEGELIEADWENLSYLDFRNTQITDAGLKEVAKLQKLEELDLRGSEVTKAGVAEFKRALPNCQIDGP